MVWLGGCGEIGVWCGLFVVWFGWNQYCEVCGVGRWIVEVWLVGVVWKCGWVRVWVRCICGVVVVWSVFYVFVWRVGIFFVFLYRRKTVPLSFNIVFINVMFFAAAVSFVWVWR